MRGVEKEGRDRKWTWDVIRREDGWTGYGPCAVGMVLANETECWDWVSGRW
jgi:hypothetical protein